MEDNYFRIYLNFFVFKCLPVIENCLGVFSDTFKNVNDDSKLLPVNNDPGERKKNAVFSIIGFFAPRNNVPS